MSLFSKYWMPIAVVALLLIFLTLVNCHFVAPPFRKADAVIEMKATGYCACGKCCGWKRTWYGMPVYNYGKNEGKYKKVGLTASGRMARPGTVAVDRSLFPMGTKFHIPGYGWAVARDVGGAINENHLDLFFEHHKRALRWGVQTHNVKVWYPRD